jgi:deoxyribose-phosphate aldolase
MDAKLRIAIGSDHGGFDLKQQLKAYLADQGMQVVDCGIREKRTADYPLSALSVALRVASGECRFGILIDGAGIGSAMAANKVRGVLAAACYSPELARNCREHNGANVLTLGAGQTSFEQAREIVSVFLATECTATRHKKRVGMIREIEQGQLKLSPGALRRNDPNEEETVQLTAEDIEAIALRVKEMLTSEGGGAAAAAGLPRLNAAELAAMIDHTLLKPAASIGDIERLCKEAMEYHFFSVCVNPSYVPRVRSLLKGSDVKIACVVGFPLGAAAPEIKALEARKAIREGSDEIDMVINIGALKSGDYDLVERDIRGVVEACVERRAICKVILETSILTNDEKVKACELSMKAGAQYVKTSTGFGSGGATVEDIRLMSATVAPKRLGVKASGGVRTYDDAMQMIAAGATRIGASSSVKIMEEARAKAGAA